VKWQPIQPKAARSKATAGLIDTQSGHQGGTMKRIGKNEFKESDTARLNDLAEQYGLHFKRSGMIYRFEDYTAFGLDQALGYVEGFDRAMGACVDAKRRRK
jgi:hypothetical protein